MGPIALFDKSFLQSLSLDEAVWFDHFFVANVAPVFFVETLADLEKAVREGRTPESEVGVIAEKTPVLGGAPCANHIDMAIGELLGYPIPMTGQIPVAGGHFVRTAGKTGVVFKGLPEAEAFARWQRHEFLVVERRFARLWRDALASLDLASVAAGLRAVGLPQCMIFVSGDRLHQRCAPLFLRPDQEFIWAPDMKAELRRVNDYFMALPDATKEKGIMSFARMPPGDDDSLLARMWDRHFPGYRQRMLCEPPVFNPVRDEALAGELSEFTEGKPLMPEEIGDFDPQEADCLTIERMISRKRGSWWQIPKDLDVDEDVR